MEQRHVAKKSVHCTLYIYTVLEEETTETVRYEQLIVNKLEEQSARKEDKRQGHKLGRKVETEKDRNYGADRRTAETGRKSIYRISNRPSSSF
jgi:hypothetical protein